MCRDFFYTDYVAEASTAIKPLLPRSLVRSVILCARHPV